MYSSIPGIQILLRIFKENNIKHFVISPGTRNTALVHSIENDSFFSCYSVVDERSAGFFALGLSEELDEPVCVTCTAATATCNYMPAIKEAYEREINLIALTADQDDYSKFHMGDQNINQRNMYDGYINYAVDVPKIYSNDDYWFFNRSIHEAILSLNHQKGPIQINYKMDYGLDELATCIEKEIYPTRIIKSYQKEDIKDQIDELKNKKIMIFAGSDTQIDTKSILEFEKKTGCVILSDLYGNIHSNHVVNPSVLGDFYENKDYLELKPDIIILLGSIVYAPIKNNWNLFRNDVITYQVSVDGTLNDGFRNVQKIFHCSTNDFFKEANRYLKTNSIKGYREKWDQLMKQIIYPDLEFTHFKVIQKFLSYLPKNTILHMSVLDAIRISNYFKADAECFANIGADGIDGALSTFLGQASQTDRLAFLIIGDLSFLYDMNGLFKTIPNNVRILLINNHAGSEFHKNFGLEKIPTLNDYIAASHNSDASMISSFSNLTYLEANQENLDSCLEKFTRKTNKPILLEVFTDADKDAKKLKEFWNINRPNFKTKNAIRKEKLEKILGKRIVRILEKIRRR